MVICVLGQCATHIIAWLDWCGYFPAKFSETILCTQVHFFLKRRVGSLSEEEHARLDRLALGLRMLGALPLPWQQRCSALHEHPRLILETLLMGKQLRAASQVSDLSCL
jgi:hypothetical protein